MDKVILSERNKTIFIIDGYKFRFHKNLGNLANNIWTQYLDYYYL
jgi:hypothetical protein